MRRIRVIPVLGINRGKLVKTTRFKKPRYIGDPLNAIKIFNEKEVDELMIADIRATTSNLEPDFSMIADMAAECFMPLSYAGGIRNIDQAKRIFDLGIEKVIIGSAFLYKPDIVEQISLRYGSQSVAVCIDAYRGYFGKVKVFSHSGRRGNKVKAEHLAKFASETGAGEIIIHGIHKEGLMKGYDLRLIKSVSAAVDVPVIALGGSRGVVDFLEAVKAGASAVAASSAFVYNSNNSSSILINYPDQYLLEEKVFSKI